MQMFFLSALVLGAIMLIMSVGVIMGRKPIAGSCGGMSALGMDVACDICGGDQTICETESQKNLGYDATQAQDAKQGYDATQVNNTNTKG